MSVKVVIKTKTSPLWEFFAIVDENYANCNMCNQTISYKTSTSNLKKHLQNKHPTIRIPTLGSTETFGRLKKPKVAIETETNPVWTFFTAVDKHFAHCNVCNQKFSYKTSTSNLKKHLKSKHPTVTIPPPGSIPPHKRLSTVPTKVSNKTKTSPLWKFFTAVDAHYATCNICRQEFSYKTSTTNLKKHLNTKHRSVKIDDPASATLHEDSSQAQVTDPEIESEDGAEPQPYIRPHQPSTSISGHPQIPRVIKKERQHSVQTPDTLLPRKISATPEKRIDKKLLNLFIQDFQPFSMVEDKGFQEFVSVLNPNYQLPPRHVISKTLIPAIYEECQTKAKALIDMGKTFCVTTDSWTSVNEVSFSAITAHFLDDNFKLISVLLECCAIDTPEDLASELQRVTTEWGIKNKIILAVSDNTSNIPDIKSAVGWKHLRCVGHTIDLIVKDGLNDKNIQTTINKVKEIGRHFRKSNMAHNKLMIYQESLGKTLPLKLILEVSMGWNSTFYMLQRFIELEEAVKSVVAIIEQELPILTEEEWKTIKELCQILRPFEDATKTISGEKYCTASLVIPICNGIKITLLKLSKKQFSKPVKKVLEVLQSSFEERLGNVENINILSVSTFLDPKFKQMAFSNDTTANSVKQEIIDMIAAKITTRSEEHQTEAETSDTEAQTEHIYDEEDEEETSIWSDFDKNVAAHQPNSTSRAIIEMQRYMEEEIMPRHSDSFHWWHQHRQMLPYLSEVAQDRLCTLASPIPCERHFPEAGQLLAERRNRLKDDTVQKLVFLNANHIYLS